MIVRWAHGPHNGIPDAGILGNIHQVAGGGELRATRQAVAMNLRNDRFCQVPDPEKSINDMPGPIAVAAGRVEGLVRSIIGF